MARAAGVGVLDKPRVRLRLLVIGTVAVGLAAVDTSTTVLVIWNATVIQMHYSPLL